LDFQRDGILDKDAETAKIRTIVKELDGVSLQQARRMLDRCLHLLDELSVVSAKENKENLEPFLDTPA